MNQNGSKQQKFAANRWRDRLVELEIKTPDRELKGIPDLELALATIRARENELNCIYSFTQLRERDYYDIDEFLATAVDILPPWWQYPEVACASIVMGQ